MSCLDHHRGSTKAVSTGSSGSFLRTYIAHLLAFSKTDLNKSFSYTAVVVIKAALFAYT